MGVGETEAGKKKQRANSDGKRERHACRPALTSPRAQGLEGTTTSQRELHRTTAAGHNSVMSVRANQRDACMQASHFTFPSFLVWPAASPTLPTLPTLHSPTNQGLWMHVLLAAMQPPCFHLSRLTKNARSPCNLAFHEDET